MIKKKRMSHSLRYCMGGTLYAASFQRTFLFTRTFHFKHCINDRCYFRIRVSPLRNLDYAIAPLALFCVEVGAPYPGPRLLFIVHRYIRENECFTRGVCVLSRRAADNWLRVFRNVCMRTVSLFHN